MLIHCCPWCDSILYNHGDKFHVPKKVMNLFRKAGLKVTDGICKECKPKVIEGTWKQEK